MTSPRIIASAWALGAAIALSVPALAADDMDKAEKAEQQDMSLGEAAGQAQQDTERLGDKAGEAAKDAANAAERGYEWTREKARDAYNWSKKQVDEATK